MIMVMMMLFLYTKWLWMSELYTDIGSAIAKEWLMYCLTVVRQCKCDSRIDVISC